MVTSIRVLTYNMSFTTQMNVVEYGSEKDFVERCRQKYKKGGLQCTENAITKLGYLKHLDLLALQEVQSDLEKKIKVVQPLLTNSKRVKVGLETLALMWNPDIFGKLLTCIAFPLSTDGSRPCMVCVFEHNEQKYIVMNTHGPWIRKDSRHIDKKNLQDILTRQLHKNADSILNKELLNDQCKIIFCGDFNDRYMTITRNRPLQIFYKDKKITLSHKKTKKELSKIKSCCWHQKNHIYGHFSGPGDYVLINNNITMIDMFIPKQFDYIQRDKLLFSDHKPVIALLSM